MKASTEQLVISSVGQFLIEETTMATNPRDNLIAWLRDAHAMEEQAITMLNSQLNRLENYPALKARIGQHLEETKRQEQILQTCLDRLGEGSSSLKDTAGKLTAMAQGMSGIFASDEVVKGSLASYTFEHMEIASYRILIAAADVAGDVETKRACEGILEEEIFMANWLSDHMDEVTRQFLLRDEADLSAKR
jgi:ferritin-like metal-binding protein YciE